jgi:hypothetical protein
VRHPIAQKLQDLASNLETLKSRVRLALADEMAKAVGAAARDMLIVALCDRFAAASASRSSPHHSPGPGKWRSGYERDGWDEDDSHVDYPRSTWRESAESAPEPPVPTAAAVAVGVQVGRWWFRRHGGMPLSLGVGAVATMVGLSGGVAARAVLAVLAAGVDLLTADTDLARTEHSRAF